MKTLAVKYRPQGWDSVVEQKAITMILQEQVKTSTQKHSYLFVGPAGCGKTTCARIFADELNRGQGFAIEIDAASNSGVENVRGIVEDAKRKPIAGEYKIYIVDECFHANTLIDTPQGKKRICSMRPGDEVLNLAGRGTVTQVHENSVLTSRLCCVTVNGNKLVTTVDHLFFTDEGWVPAKNLREGQELYGTETVSAVWEKIYKQAQQRKILQSSLFCAVQERTQTPYSYEGAKMCDLRHGISDSEMFDKAVLLENLCAQTVCEEEFRQNLFRSAEAAVVKEQSDAQSRNCSENAYHSKSERNFGYGFCGTWREWEIHQASITVARQSAGVCTGVCNPNRTYTEDGVLPHQLQSRPRLSFFAAGDRGGWQNSFEEITTVVGRKENSIAANFRVDSVEIYKRGDNERLFSDCFSSEQLQEKTVSMYDLEVDSHSSYYANDVLVHNCHSLSNGAWQAFLKLLEEPPASAIFIFCTTDPQKIPATIISRVQRYDFSKMSLQGIKNRLDEIIRAEHLESGAKIAVEPDAVDYIAKLAEGGMRDAITMLDKCLSYTNQLNLHDVLAVLGTTDYSIFFGFMEAILNKDMAMSIEFIENEYENGKDLKQFMRSFQSFLVDVVKYKVFNGFDTVNIPDVDDNKEIMDSEDILDIISLVKWAQQVNNDIKWDPNPRVIVNAAVILKASKKENKNET